MCPDHKRTFEHILHTLELDTQCYTVCIPYSLVLQDEFLQNVWFHKLLKIDLKFKSQYHVVLDQSRGVIYLFLLILLLYNLFIIGNAHEAISGLFKGVPEQIQVTL